MQQNFIDISRGIWREMRKGTPYEQPEPDTGEYTDDFYNGAVNFPKLAEFIRSGHTTNIFNRADFIPDFAKTPVQITDDSGFEPSEIQLRKNIPFTYINEQGIKIETPIFGQLNKRIDYLDKKNNWSYTLEINPQIRKISAGLSWFYDKTESKRKPAEATLEYPDSITVENKYKAIILSTTNLSDFLYLIKELDGDQSFDRRKGHLAKVYAFKLRNAQTAEELNFLYENIPNILIEPLKNAFESDFELLEKHLKDLKKYGNKGAFSIFRDSSGAIINLLCIMGSDNIYSTFKQDPLLVKELYNNMKHTSVINGIEQENKIVFTGFLRALCHENSYLGFRNAPRPTFKIGKNYQLDSNLFPVNDKDKTKIFLQQGEIQMRTQSIYDDSGYSPDPVEIKQPVTVWENDGAYYHPLEPVFLIDMDTQDKTPLRVPAIFVKSISDEAERKDIQKTIRIGADILAIILGIASLGSSSPFWVIVGAADIGLSSIDTFVVMNEDELMQTEKGRKFLEAWHEIYEKGGLAIAVISFPALVRSTFSKGMQLLTLTKNVAPRNVLKNCLLEIILETNIHNFTGNTVKILETNTEIVTATKGFVTSPIMRRLQQEKAIFLSGEVKVGNKTVTQTALVYKGEILMQGEPVEFSQSIRKLAKVHYSPEKIREILEGIINRRKIVTVSDLSKIGETSKTGAPVTFKLIDELNNIVGEISRATEKSNKLVYRLIQNSKKIDIKSSVQLFDETNAMSNGAAKQTIQKGEHLLYADFNIPIKITDKISGLGKIMLDDALAYFQKHPKFGQVDGTIELWTTQNIYDSYGGSSLILQQFWKNVKKGMSNEQAALETFSGKWAKQNGFGNVRIKDPDHDILKEEVMLNFTK